MKFLVPFLFFSLSTFAQMLPQKLIYKDTIQRNIEKVDFTDFKAFQNEGLYKKAIYQSLQDLDRYYKADNLYGFIQAKENFGRSYNYRSVEEDSLQIIVFDLYTDAVNQAAPYGNFKAMMLKTFISNYYVKNAIIEGDESLDWPLIGKLSLDDREKVIDKLNELVIKDPEVLMTYSGRFVEYPTYTGELVYPSLFEYFLLNNAPYQYNYNSQERTAYLPLIKETAQLLNVVPENEIDSIKFSYYYHLEQLNYELKRYEYFAQYALTRINDVYSMLNMDISLKDTALFESLVYHKNLLKSDAASAQFSYAIANFYASRALNYVYTDDHYLNYFNLALSEIEESLQKFPNSKSKLQLISLKNQILSKNLSFSFKIKPEKNKASLLNVRFRNMDKAEINVFQITGRKKKEHYYNPLLDLYLSKLEVKHLELQADENHNYHSADFILKALPSNGEYLILVGEYQADLTKALTIDTLDKLENLSFEIFKVSNLSIATSIHKGIASVLLVNSDTGAPIKGASVKAKGYRENYSGETNEMGIFTFKPKDNYNNFNITAKYKDDIAESDLYAYRDYEDVKTPEYRVFSDRSIYRPGQNIYFKIIAIEERNERYEILKDHDMNVEIYDQNGTKIYSEKFKSNEFGSVSSEFKLPMSGYLLGSLSISVNGVYGHSFSVEEYKRPTFEVNFEKTKDQYSYGDSVKITGTVKALAGYPVANANVELTIHPTFYYYRWYNPKPNEDETQFYTVKTDDEGKFEFSFLAEESKNHYGQYYSITAKAVDISGETHQAYTAIMVGKSALRTYFSGLNEIVRSDEQNQIKIFIENAQNVEQKDVKANFKIERISQDFRKELGKAEFNRYASEDFAKYFPDHTFKKSTEFTSVAKGELFSGDSLLIKKLIDGAVGDYQIIVDIIDKKGDTIHNISNFSFIDVNKNENKIGKDLWISFPDNTNVLPGKTIEFIIGSKNKDQAILLNIINKDGVKKSIWEYPGYSKTIKYEFTEADKSGVNFHVLACHDDVFQTKQEALYFVDDTRNLDITLETKRDKLIPGVSEKWILKIKQKDQLVGDAELLASMYDASLDAFRSNYWSAGFNVSNYIYYSWNTYQRSDYSQKGSYFESFYFDNSYNSPYGFFANQDVSSGRGRVLGNVAYDYDMVSEESVMAPAPIGKKSATRAASVSLENKDERSEDAEGEGKNTNPEPPLQMRENFNETAFFYPNIYAQNDGSYHLEFTLPDALTKWKLMTFAHTKDLKSGTSSAFFEAKKDLMIQANEPRFFRENDKYVFAAKAINTSGIKQNTKVSLRIFDPVTNEDLSQKFGIDQTQNIILDSMKSEAVSWTLSIPQNVSFVQYELKIIGENFADGETKPIPVLSNRMHIQIAQPFVKNSKGESTFEFNDYKKLSSSAEKLSFSLRLETQTLWSAMMSLPYMMEFPYECSEQLFARYFSNVIALKILKENPEFEAIVKLWKAENPDAFISALEKNPELKQIVLTETPWVLDARAENEQKARLANLFNAANLEIELKHTLKKLEKQKANDGGWGWWKSDKSNIYITQYILSGFGRLEELGVEIDKGMLNSALDFLDREYTKSYNKLSAKDKANKYGVGEMTVNYLLTRTYFKRKNTPAVDYYYPIMLENWKNFGLQTQASIGIVCLSKDNKALATTIKNSLLDRSIFRAERGRYWNNNIYGYYWYQSPIETQSIMVEFFKKFGAMETELSQMQLWLILNKRTNSWETTKAATLACNALLLSKSESVGVRQISAVFSNGEEIALNIQAPENKFMKTGNEIKDAYAKLTLTSNSIEPILGAFQLSYLEDIDKVEKSTGSFTVERHYFYMENGKQKELKKGEVLELGTKILVKILLTTTQDLEFVHIKDSKASGFEPVSTISGYKYDKLYYFQTNRDATTEIFIDDVRKGSYYFEYEIFVTAKGELIAGPLQAECMYAPEYRAHTASDKFIIK